MKCNNVLCNDYEKWADTELTKLRAENTRQREENTDLHQEATSARAQLRAIDAIWRRVLVNVSEGTIPPGLINQMSDALSGIYYESIHNKEGRGS